MPIKNYSTTAGNNTASPPNGAPIGTTKVSQLDDIQRQVMADIREYYNTPEWRDLGHTVTFVSSTSFRIGSDVTSSYRMGQRIRISDSSTLYGTIASATFSNPNTTIVVTLDSGSITSSISAVAVGVNPDNDPIPASALSGLVAEANLPFTLPVGMVSPYAGSTAPSGWLLCRGQEVSRTTYAALDAVIGTTYGAYTNGSGGAGTTHLRLPDLQGRVVAGLEATATRLTSAGSGVDGGTLGANGGSQFMQQHNHGITDPTHAHTQQLARSTGTIGTMVSNAVGATNGVVSGVVSDNFNGNAVTTLAASTGITVNNAGSGTSQNVQPTLVLNYIIKV